MILVNVFRNFPHAFRWLGKLTFFLFLLPVGLMAQVENCTNGLDDDGDGLVDYYDPDCGCGTVGCGNAYYNICAPTCSAPLPAFNIQAAQAWSHSGANASMVPLVGDIDGDCTPDILLKGSSGQMKVLNSTNGALKYAFSAFTFNYTTTAIGNVDADPEVEVFVTANSSGGYRINRYDYNSTGNFMQLTWSASTTVNPRYGPSLADFNQDGIPEVYTGNQIFSSQTGLEIANGGATNNQGYYPLGSSVFMVSTSVAADVLPTAQCTNCDALELVAGNQVYAVNLVSMTNPALNSMTVAVTGPERDGSARLVDFDRDGDLDAVCTAMTGITFGARIWVWDLQTPAQIGQTFSPPNASSPRIGPPTIADFDNDGWPEIAICTSLNFSVLHDFNTAGGATWGSNNATTLAATLTTTDQSGATGITAFDFNGDGAYEIVYRDQTQLRVFNSTLTTVASFGCTSGTATEYPVIADIDADGDTEILVTCGSNLVAYESANTPWIPARSIWNQFNYFNVNVNDDGSIPRQQQQHHIVGDSIILNNFMVQQAVLDTGGIPLLPIPDVGLVILDDTCLTSQVRLEIELCNTGDQTFPSGTPIAFYDADPTTVNAGLITVQNAPTNIAVGTCDTFLVTLGASLGPVYAVANDDGTLARPYNLGTQFPVTNVLECNYLNNVDNVNFNCTQFVGGIDSTWNNPCNGSTQGAIFASATGPFPAYTYSLDGINFQATGTFLNLPAGNYTLTIRDAMGTDTTLTTMIQAPPVLVIQATSVTNVSCFGGNDGQVSVGASGGTPPYTYALNGGLFQQISAFSNLTAGNQTIILEDVNGCRDTIVQAITQPTALVLSVDSLSPSSACASALVELSALGGTPGYMFELTGYPFQASGTFQGVPSGNLWAVARDANGCLDSTAILVAGVPSLQVVVGAQTTISCNGLTDGSVDLVGSGGIPSFEFSLDNTTYQAGNSFANLAAGNYMGYVRDSTGCVDSVAFTIVEPPVLTISLVTATDISCANGTDGSLIVTGSGGTPGLEYRLNGGAFQSSGTFSGLTSGSYTITVRDANGCTAQLTESIIEPLPLAIDAVVIVDETCANAADGEISIAVSGGTPNYQYALNGGTPQNGATFTGLAPGTYALTVTDANGCMVNTTEDVLAGSAPTAAFSVLLDPCEPDQAVQFTNESQNGVSYSWDFGNGQSSTDLDPLFAFASEGNWPVTLTVTDANGCTATASQSIDLYALPIAAFSATPDMPIVVESGTDFQFTNESQNSVTWVWEFGDGAGSTLENPSYAYNELGKFCVTLFAYNQVGCEDSTRQCEIEVEDLYLYVPTGFTPNGDGLNDRFGITTSITFASATFEIFNRWGKVIYTADSLTDWWDATHQGQPVQEGVYLFRFVGVSQSGKSISRAGSVTLIR